MAVGDGTTDPEIVVDADALSSTEVDSEAEAGAEEDSTTVLVVGVSEVGVGAT